MNTLLKHQTKRAKSSDMQLINSWGDHDAVGGPIRESLSCTSGGQTGANQDNSDSLIN